MMRPKIAAALTPNRPDNLAYPYLTEFLLNGSTIIIGPHDMIELNPDMDLQYYPAPTFGYPATSTYPSLQNYPGA